MKFFIDTADIREVREAAAMGLVDGVTTNPSLVAKTGRKFRDVLLDRPAQMPHDVRVGLERHGQRPVVVLVRPNPHR